MTRRVFIGTSGWTYDHWQGVFYPEDLPRSRWFSHYAAIFSTVEINATFYRRFQASTYENWFVRAPQDFRYVLKVPRYVTHRRLLKEVGDEIRAFCDLAALLGEHLALLLLQLSPATPYDLRRLAEALDSFPEPQRVAVELRHPRWQTDEVHDLLRSYGAICCLADAPGCPLREIRTSGRAYLRLHGRRCWYADDYTPEELAEMAALVRRLLAGGAEEVYCFFNNDAHAYSVQNARVLMSLLADLDTPEE